MRYEKTLSLSRTKAEYMNMLLQSTNRMGEDDTISNTVVFDDGIEMDIKLCGAKDDFPWTEAVLFKNGCEVGCTEPGDGYMGEWCIEHEDNEYVVTVSVAQ